MSAAAGDGDRQDQDVEEEQYFTDPEDIIDLSRLSDSVIRVSPTPDSALSAPSKVELLRSLSYLEAELQASDAAIDALRASKSRLAFYQAKYVRLVLPDSFSSALGGGGHQQTSSGAPSAGSESTNAKSAAIDEESQMGQLENLIDVQRRAHACMTVQLEGLRNKLKKASRDLLEERCKHEQDSAEGDDVLAGLGKERERLLNELEYERSHNRRQEKELKRQLRSLEEARSANAKQRAVALEQIRQRKRATEQLSELAERCRQLEARQSRLTVPAAEAAESVAAAAHRRVVELGHQAQAEAANADRLAAEVEALRLRLTATTTSTSTTAASTAAAASTAGRRGAKPEPPVRRTPETPRPRPPGTTAAASASRLPMSTGGGGGGAGAGSPKRTAAGSARPLAAAGGASNGK